MAKADGWYISKAVFNGGMATSGGGALYWDETATVPVAMPKPTLVVDPEEAAHWTVLRDHDPDPETYWKAVEFFSLLKECPAWIVPLRVRPGRSPSDAGVPGHWICLTCKMYNLVLVKGADGLEFRCGSGGACRGKGSVVAACPITHMPIRAKQAPSLASQQDATRKALAEIWEFGYMTRDQTYIWLQKQLEETVLPSCWRMNPGRCAVVQRLAAWYLSGGTIPRDKPPEEA